jgi:acetylornithine deacetylase/succinyl-diaminopimelate desuccinylase-like protein
MLCCSFKPFGAEMVVDVGPAGYNQPIMEPIAQILARLEQVIDRRRLVETATRLIEVPSPTGAAGDVLDRLDDLLAADGFKVHRPSGGHESAPALAVTYAGVGKGRTLQFNGHLDTVHLPFVPPSVEGDLLKGSGASDMKGGFAAAVEAVRAVRDSGLLTSGSILLTAHDLHEAPWGDGRQLDRLITEGLVGDAVLLPEPLSDRLPVVGRGQACWKATIRRPGPPVHEVMRPLDEPSVIAAGAEFVARLGELDRRLSQTSTDPVAGPSSVFIGQFHGGEIYNQYPHECTLEGTRRWLPGSSRVDVERELRDLATGLEHATGTTVDLRWQVVRDAFKLDQSDSFVIMFQSAYETVAGRALPTGSKPFVDDGNSFWSLAKVPAITHGPRAGGQHTVEEWVSIDDLVRVSKLYALIAILYCQAETSTDGHGGPGS